MSAFRFAFWSSVPVSQAWTFHPDRHLFRVHLASTDGAGRSEADIDCAELWSRYWRRSGTAIRLERATKVKRHATAPNANPNPLECAKKPMTAGPVSIPVYPRVETYAILLPSAPPDSEAREKIQGTTLAAPSPIIANPNTEPAGFAGDVTMMKPAAATSAPADIVHLRPSL